MKYKFSICEYDKISTNNFILLILTVILYNVSVIKLAHTEATKGINWSFSDQPHPADHTLTRDEKAPLEEIAQGQGFSEYCSKLLRTHFNIYNDRFPKFTQAGSADKRFLAWKHHVVVDGFSDGYNGAKHCAQFMAFHQALDPYASNNLRFCGAFSDRPKSPSERKFRNAIEEMISYADAGNLDALDSLLILHSPGSNVMLNPDVEFYIRKALQINDEYEDVWYTGHLEPLLSPERIAFVEDAVERGDFEAVLDTTSPCVVQ